MKKEIEIIETKDAPSAIGPYSQAVEAGGFLFVSGQVGFDPKTTRLVPGGIVEQTAQILDNIRAVLSARKIAFDRIVKVTVYLTSMDDFSEMNRIYGLYFKSGYPARETVQVSRLPKGALIEISCIALLKKG